ncbi:GTP cyclohydrolase 1 type 2/Nif3 [Dipodascopsis tothii]|uniref:GTP cyclohydrolase 1 type 2/Nif3 n=1 Tax=Dipodascopsis tothii TaxID=44089 RepID=UPI0034CF5E6C
MSVATKGLAIPAQQVVKRLVSAVQELYPPALADSSWDNTGLLLEPLPPLRFQKPHEAGEVRRAKVLLTIDLTTAVVDEAIRKSALMIVTYHPIIFRGLKAITQADTQQLSLMRLAQEGISVYSPHTAVDAQVGGVNDWLVSVIGGAEPVSSKVIIPNSPTVGTVGMGRVINMKSQPFSVRKIVENLKAGLGIPYVQVALSTKHADLDAPVQGVALCAGSGGSVFSKLKPRDKKFVDLWVTGELGHHELLAAHENGISVVICGHANSERGFLAQAFKAQLEAQLAKSQAADAEWATGYDFDVEVSEADRDFVIVA